MGIFSDIIGKIFHHAAPAPEAAPADAPAPDAAAAPAPAAPPAVAPLANVDVAAVLDDLAAKDGRGLNWRVSIVDMMTLLGLDSSLSHRRDLAGELNYDGDTDDTATMNIWLHKQVIQQLAANGGKVPDDLAN
jgi:hypothetical protein